MSAMIALGKADMRCESEHRIERDFCGRQRPSREVRRAFRCQVCLLLL